MTKGESHVSPWRDHPGNTGLSCAAVQCGFLMRHRTPATSYSTSSRPNAVVSPPPYVVTTPLRRAIVNRRRGYRSSRSRQPGAIYTLHLRGKFATAVMRRYGGKNRRRVMTSTRQAASQPERGRVECARSLCALPLAKIAGQRGEAAGRRLAFDRPLFRTRHRSSPWRRC